MCHLLEIVQNIRNNCIILMNDITFLESSFRFKTAAAKRIVTIRSHVTDIKVCLNLSLGSQTRCICIPPLRRLLYRFVASKREQSLFNFVELSIFVLRIRLFCSTHLITIYNSFIS